MGLFGNGEDTEKRFTEIAAQNIGLIESRIMRDNLTGVNYIFATNMTSGGVSVTPLLDDTGGIFVDYDGDGLPDSRIE